jgi:hypothetical protein
VRPFVLVPARFSEALLCNQSSDVAAQGAALFKVFLVILFGAPERLGGNDLGDDGF